MRQNEGFTLLELLLVIVIIGTLATVLLPTVLGAQKRAYDKAAMTCANTVSKAVATWQIDHPGETSVPDESQIQSEEYGGSTCTTEQEITLTRTVGEGTTNYAYTVSHAKGQNVYTVTPQGLSSALKQ